MTQPSSTPDNELAPGVGVLPGAFTDGITFMEVRTVEPLTVTYLKSELAAHIREREAKLVRDAYQKLYDKAVEHLSKIQIQEDAATMDLLAGLGGLPEDLKPKRDAVVAERRAVVLIGSMMSELSQESNPTEESSHD